MNLGQVKAVARLFYDRLAAAGALAPGNPPWSGVNADDHALANMGQLKTVFTFDIPLLDANGNGIPDTWEMQMFGNLDQDMDADFDYDGLSNREEFLAGTSAALYDTDGDGWDDWEELAYGGDPNSVTKTPSAAAVLAAGYDSYDIDSLQANDRWYVAENLNVADPQLRWFAAQDWYYLGESCSDSGHHTSRPATPLRPMPDSARDSDEHWQRDPPFWNYNLYYDANRLGPQDYVPGGAYLPIANHWDESESTGVSNSQELGWGVNWKRYRMRLPAALSEDAEKTYLKVTYEWDKENVEWVPYDIWDIWSEGYWQYPEPTVHSVEPVKMTLKKDRTEGEWLYVTPAAENNKLLSVRLLPIDIRWEAKPEFNNLSDNKSPVDYVWHIQRSVGAQDGRWMPGRGFRIFPDKETPTGQLRNKVLLKIKAASARPDKKVFVRVYDVDDPTPTRFDLGGQVDTNGDAGGDNIGSDQNHGEFHFINGGAVANASVQNLGNSQQFASCDVTLDANNTATIEMQVSMQPGDNFRAAVARDPADFSSIQVTSPGGSGFLKPSNEVPQGFKGAVSDMLTVWRSLNLEFETMAAVPEGNHPPDKQPVTGLQWPSSSRVMVAPLGVPDDFYMNGTAFVGNSQLAISASGSSSLTFAAPVDEATQAQMTNHEFSIVDDDGRGLPADFTPMLPHQLSITDLLRARFVTSYIELKDVGSLNEDAEIPFQVNLDQNSMNASMASVRNVSDSHEYWSHQIVSAYQPVKDADRDPNLESPTYGSTWPDRPRWSVVFLETIRDTRDAGLNFVSQATRIENQEMFRIDVEGTIAHEIAHAPPPSGFFFGFFHKDHDEKGLIGEGVVEIKDHVFEPVTIMRFRNTFSWGEKP